MGDRPPGSVPETVQVIVELGGTVVAVGSLWLRKKAIDLAEDARKDGADVDVSPLTGAVRIRARRKEDAERFAHELDQLASDESLRKPRRHKKN